MSEEFVWGRIRVPAPEATEHFAVLGATGSGKSALIGMLMRSVLSQSDGRFRRAFIYDPKQDLVGPLCIPHLGMAARVKILNPLDSRCHAWDIASDIDGPVSARQFAAILVPSENDSGGNQFFTDAVRDLLTGVLLAFVACTPRPREWTFRDVLLAMLYEPYLQYVLALEPSRTVRELPMLKRVRHSYVRNLLEPEAGPDPRTAANIRATINARLSIFEPIAACWFDAWLGSDSMEPKRLSLAQWVGSNDLLVVSNDEASREATDAVIRAMFKRATELILGRQDPKDFSQTWFFLDEVREAGRLTGLSSLLTRGRSKNACVVIGFQDIEGLRSVYGQEVANELVGQCSNIAVLRLNSPGTAEWASGLFGRQIVSRPSRSMTVSGGGASVERGDSEQESSVVQTRSFLTLPRTSPESGIYGYFKDPNDEAEEPVEPEHLDWGRHVKPYLLDDLTETEENVVPRPPSEHYLKPWNKEDWKRLGFPGSPPSLDFESTPAAERPSKERVPRMRRNPPGQ